LLNERVVPVLADAARVHQKMADANPVGVRQAGQSCRAQPFRNRVVEPNDAVLGEAQRGGSCNHFGDAEDREGRVCRHRFTAQAPYSGGARPSLTINSLDSQNHAGYASLDGGINHFLESRRGQGCIL
jgi:hypothetical protein